MVKGFKEFLLRGNVVDLAVAVVIGTAFTALVTAVVTNIFSPIISAIFKANSFDKLWVVSIPLAAGTADIKFGAVVGAIINFVLIAAVVYFVFVVPINALLKRAYQRQQAEPASADPAPPTELDLLVQIRDLLKDRPVADDARSLKIE